MKIACIGNMNNSLFTLTRYLRERGFDVELLVENNCPDHFQPHSDTFDLSFTKFCRQVSWGDFSSYLNVSKDSIRADLAEYDFLIGSGTAPAFVHTAGRRLDLFLPYGSDLYEMPFFKFHLSRYTWSVYKFAKAQFDGLRETVNLQAGPNMHHKDFFAKLNYQGNTLHTGTTIVHTGTFNNETIGQHYNKMHWSHEFQRIRDNHGIVVFHPSRHEWKENVPLLTDKANDRLIQGFANFLAGNKERNPALVMVEYGSNVQHSKTLVRELGIEENVYWFPKMVRKDIMGGISLCDIVASEFEYSHVVGGVICEALAMRKPLLAWRDDSIHSGYYDHLYPIMRAKTTEEITQALASYANNPKSYLDMAQKGWEWHQRFAVERPLSIYLEAIRRWG